MTENLGIYAEHGPAALDHDVAQLLTETLLTLTARGVDYATAIAAIRRVARGKDWN